MAKLTLPLANQWWNG